jgi:hypothetical protein
MTPMPLAQIAEALGIPTPYVASLSDVTEEVRRQHVLASCAATMYGELWKMVEHLDHWGVPAMRGLDPMIEELAACRDRLKAILVAVGVRIDQASKGKVVGT